MTGEIPKVEPKGFWDVMYAIFWRRLSSPIMSTYVISWCVTNYKVLLIVFGKGKLDDKLKHLDNYFSGLTISIPVWPHI